MFLAPTLEKPKENQGFGLHGLLGSSGVPWGPHGIPSGSPKGPMGPSWPPMGTPWGPMGPGPRGPGRAHGPQGLYRQTPDQPPYGGRYVLSEIFD